MANKISSGIILLFLLSSLLNGVDKSKKAYELIYQDVQVLKQKILLLEEKIEKNSEDLKVMKSELNDLFSTLRKFQEEQARFNEDQKKIPALYQVLLEKIEMLNTQFMKFSAELSALKSVSFPESELAEGKASSPQKEREKPQAEEKPRPMPPPTLSPQEIYNMAYSDYLNGNYDLAREGFQLYVEQFPDSPLADNAAYWIGECYFSQGKFEKAIDEFNELILNYSHGDKIPVAYLKKGISLSELGRKEEAIAVFKLLISKYPLEEETKIAQQKIKELQSKDEGHKQS